MTQGYVDIVLFPVDSLVIPILSGSATLLVALICLFTKFIKQPLGAMVFGINFAHFIFHVAKLFPTFVPPTSDLYCEVVQLIAHTSLLSSVILGSSICSCITLNEHLQHYRSSAEGDEVLY